MSNLQKNLVEIESLLINKPDIDPEELLFYLDSFYECPKDKNGNRLGPLVGYAGTYGPDKKHFVGDIYLNFAPVEEYYFIIMQLAIRLYGKLGERIGSMPNVFCGAPEGGKALAQTLSSLEHYGRYVYPDTKVTVVGTKDGREEKKFIWGRHSVILGERVAIVEDLNNNFSTTAELIKLVEGAGAVVVAIVSYYNRSVLVTGDTYELKLGEKELAIPIVTIKTNPIPQYEQEDPFVSSDVEKGNVIWKVKDNWPILKKAMEANSR